MGSRSISTIQSVQNASPQTLRCLQESFALERRESTRATPVETNGRKCIERAQSGLCGKKQERGTGLPVAYYLASPTRVLSSCAFDVSSFPICWRTTLRSRAQFPIERLSPSIDRHQFLPVVVGFQVAVFAPRSYFAVRLVGVVNIQLRLATSRTDVVRYLFQAPCP